MLMLPNIWLSTCHLQSINLGLLHLFPMTLLTHLHYWTLSGYCVCAVWTQISIFLQQRSLKQCEVDQITYYVRHIVHS
jgi:hypothetical protein